MEHVLGLLYNWLNIFIHGISSIFSVSDASFLITYGGCMCMIWLSGKECVLANFYDRCYGNILY